jgi:hypothetical protein
MKNFKFSQTTLAVMLFSSILLFDAISCSDDEDVTTKNGCKWNGNCGSIAPEGAYDCSGNSIVKCIKGKWELVTLCSSITNSKGYSCTCKGGCGTTYVECSYAFDVCQGQRYKTCGDNATATVSGGSWKCE